MENSHFSSKFVKISIGILQTFCYTYKQERATIAEGGDTMKNTGVVRRLDELGRITLPMELRKVFNIEERDSLEIYVEDDKIILKKYAPTDIFTGERDDLIEYHGKMVSKKTIEDLAKLAELI